MYKNYTKNCCSPPGYIKKMLLVMKLSIFILMISLLQVSAASFGQKLTLKQKNVSITKVFLEIRKQTGYDVLVEYKNFKTNQRIDANFVDVPLQQVMSEIVKGTNLSYTIEEKTIVIKEKGFIEKMIARFQIIDVRGKILDEKQQPLPGATVKVKGTSKVVMTGSNGEFVLTGVEENSILIITYMGYETQEVKAKKEMGIIAMVLASGKLQEIAVSTGYQTLPAERATGSFAKVDNELFNRQVSTDVISRLKGIAPSILFDERSGSPKLTIRGMSTIFGNADPLVVVDGFVYDGDIMNINPNDVEDIDILRDAAAASIWGVRASNGVIVITTKQGKQNQPIRVEMNSNVTFVGKPDLFYQPRMTSSDMLDAEMFLFQNNHFNTALNNTTTWPEITPAVEIMAAQRAGTLSEDEATRQLELLRHQDIRNDLTKYFYQTGVNQQYSLNLRGGTDKHRYYFSTGYDNNRSNQILINNNRLSLTAQQTFNPIKNLEISTGLVFTQSKNTNESSLILNTINTNRNYNARLVDELGNPLPISQNFRTSFVETAEDKGLLNWQFIPLGELSTVENRGKITENRISGGVKYTLLSGLSAEIKYQYLRQSSERRDLRNLDSYFTRHEINRFTTINPSFKQNIPLGSIINFSNSAQQSQTGRAQLNYNRTINKHAIAAIGGFEVREMTIKGNSNRLYGYDELTGVSGAVNFDTGYRTYPNNSSSFVARGEGVTEIIDRFRSYYTNASYTFDNRYSFSTSGRIDQSNLFGVNANQRSVPLWSVGSKYSVDQEEFYKVDILPVLKLRITYGYNGNLDNTITAFTTAEVGNASYTTQTEARILNPPNKNLSWERTGIFNIGLDFGFRNQRITGNIDYFSKRNIDLIGEGIVNPTTGFTTYKGNLASTKGDGLDILLNSVNIDGAFRWTSQFLFSYAVDKVIDYDLKPTMYKLYVDESINRYSNQYTPVSDRPLFGIYTNAWAGLDPETGDPRGYLDGQPSKDYTAINAEIASDPINMLVYHGRALPPYFGAVRNDFSYKGLSLSFNISYRFGNYFRRSTINYSNLFTSYNGHSDYARRWQKSGDELTTDVPSMIYPNNANRNLYYTYSEVLIERGDHIRLQDISCSYSFMQIPRLTNILKNATAFLYCNNVGLLWTANDKGIDPDFPRDKPIRTIALGLRTNF